MSLIDYFAVHIVPRMYRGKGALHPAPTGKLTDVVSCVREYDVNIFFLSKDETLIRCRFSWCPVTRWGTCAI